jgi:hypothetical protein
MEAGRVSTARRGAGVLTGAIFARTGGGEDAGASLRTGSDRIHRHAKNRSTPAMGIIVSSAKLWKDDGRCRLGSLRFPRTIILPEFYAAFFAAAGNSPKSESAFCRIRSSRSFFALSLGFGSRMACDDRSTTTSGFTPPSLIGFMSGCV